ncbi:MAG TPA: FHA domain-containing protein [Dermatophilaceae bacterium]|nr:FHA domain-containing protein [Dermatophilaceae bacterium]
MSELTLTLLRLGLLALLWIFVFSIVGVLRTDIYGTTVSRRSQRRAQRHQEKVEHKQAKERARSAQAPAPAAVSRRGRGSRVPTTLVVTEGPLAGTSLPLRQTGVLIGRNPECALVLDDDYASGRHCRIYPSGDTWYVEDLGSTNGTFMGRDRLTTPRQVEVGSSLRIGKTVLELRG